LQEGLRKAGDTEVLKEIVSPGERLSIRRQCELFGVNRSTHYYKPVEEDPEDLDVMRKMDEEYLEHPTKGVLGMVDFIKTFGILIGPKRIRRLLRKMGVMAIYPRRNLSKLGFAKYIHSYKLRGLEITHSNHVWCIDITYIPMEQGKPEIVNSDQGSQFTSPIWIEYLEGQGITISMDGRGRALDNIYIERFWRTLKQEYIYIWPAEDGNALIKGLNEYLNYYNNQRTHQSLDRKTPYDWYEYAA
jgi:putative transposase